MTRVDILMVSIFWSLGRIQRISSPPWKEDFSELG